MSGQVNVSNLGQIKEIAEKLMLPVQIISKWRKHYCHKGLGGLGVLPRPG